jgi:hypothetical protein
MELLTPHLSRNQSQNQRLSVQMLRRSDDQDDRRRQRRKVYLLSITPAILCKQIETIPIQSQ